MPDTDNFRFWKEDESYSTLFEDIGFFILHALTSRYAHCENLAAKCSLGRDSIVVGKEQ
jgi:hypothetical protein